MSKKEAAWRGGVEHHTLSVNYTRTNKKSHVTAQAEAEANLKSAIIWFPTHGLMPIYMADWLIRFFRLKAS